MQTYVLQLQGTGDDERAYEVAGVFSTLAQAQDKLRAINAEYKDDYDYEDGFFVIDDNARIEEWTLDT